jgi:hypothetical protein
MQVALICAYPASSNPGMISVDLAFNTIANSIETLKYTKFCLENKAGYVFLENLSQLEKYDRIVYWGDFLQWIEYAENDWYRRIQKSSLGVSKDDLMNRWYSLILLENRPDLQKKSIIFGSTLYGLNSKLLSNIRYFNHLKKLLDNSKLVLMRDAVSSNLVSQISEKTISYGCDCALFLDFQKTERNDKKYISFALGRSGYDSEIRKFVNDISKITKIPTFEINWLKKGTSVEDLKSHLEIMRKSIFSITDIYHFSVSSWREGTPCLCIGRGASYPLNTLSDKKKEIFYFQNFSIHNYCYVEKILENNESFLETCISNITDDISNNFTIEQIKKQKEKSLSLLLENIKT